MLAAHHDQENRAYARGAGSAVKLDGQKTLGARLHKTPLKVPLNDENAATIKGKSVLGAKPGNENLRTVGKGKAVAGTPFGEPQTTRAPLGNKTTNAKARTGLAQGVKSIVREIEKSQPPATTNQRPTRKSRADATPSSKIAVQADATTSPPCDEEDIEYAPPPLEIHYESEVFPDGVLTYKALKPERRMNKYSQFYYDSTDTKTQFSEKRLAAEQAKSFDDDSGMSVADVSQSSRYLQRREALAAGSGRKAATGAKPENKGPPTATARKAATALGSAARLPLASNPNLAAPPGKPGRPLLPSIAARKPVPQVAKSGGKPAGAAAVLSRTTLGYSTGRAASSLINGRVPPTAKPMARQPRTTTSSRPESVISSRSQEATITPAVFAKSQADKAAEEKASRRQRLGFLSIWDAELEDDSDSPVSPGNVSVDSVDIPLDF